jgi:dTDP-4-amino-4,6-dideoxygalactose transaminase
MDAVLTVLVEEKIGPGAQAQRLVQLAKEHLHFDYSLALRSPAIALGLAVKLFKNQDTVGGSPPLATAASGEPAAADAASAPPTVSSATPPPRGSAPKTPLRGVATDGVLISALSPAYYIRAIEDAGMSVVICDVDAASLCITADLIRDAVQKAGERGISIRCIALHESLGLVPDMAPLAEIGIPIIEDCSCSYGSSLSEKKAGSFGTLGILGLEEKDMLTAGGGALLFAMERRNGNVLRNMPHLPPEYGLPDMNAAMALVQFREAVRNGEKRSEIARLYTDAAMRGRHKRFTINENFEYNNYAFPLVLETGMKDVMAYAKKKEIEVENAFDNTVIGALVASQASDGVASTDEAVAEIATAKTAAPAAYSLCLRTALFPIYPRLGPLNAAKVAKLIQTLP